jgi:hypothetical protein
MSDSTTRSFVEVIVAVVIVVAIAAFVIWLLGVFAGIFWWLLKVAIVVLAVFLVVRLLFSRRR